MSKLTLASAWLGGSWDLVRDAMLATLERLFAAATDDQPGSGEFLARLSWLPKLVDEIAADGARLDG